MSDRTRLVGWKAIAARCGVTERTCRYWAARPGRPLPVYRVHGRIVLESEDLEAWFAHWKEMDARAS